MLRIYKAASVVETETQERCFIRELLNDRDCPHLSVAHCRVEPGVTTELHSLTDTTEVYVVLSGTGLMNDGSDNSYEIGPLDCVLIPAGHPQRITNTGSDQLCFLALCHERFLPQSYRPVDSVS